MEGSVFIITAYFTDLKVSSLKEKILDIDLVNVPG